MSTLAGGAYLRHARDSASEDGDSDQEMNDLFGNEQDVEDVRGDRLVSSRR